MRKREKIYANLHEEAVAITAEIRSLEAAIKKLLAKDTDPNRRDFEQLRNLQSHRDAKKDRLEVIDHILEEREINDAKRREANLHRSSRVGETGAGDSQDQRHAELHAQDLQPE